MQAEWTEGSVHFYIDEERGEYFIISPANITVSCSGLYSALGFLDAIVHLTKKKQVSAEMLRDFIKAVLRLLQGMAKESEESVETYLCIAGAMNRDYYAYSPRNDSEGELLNLADYPDCIVFFESKALSLLKR